MTEMLNKEFSRKTFLKGGGALIVGFGFAGLASSGGGASAAAPARVGPFPTNQVDSFLAIHADNTATLYQGKTELGQGVQTAGAIIAAEELRLSMSQIDVVRNIDTTLTPDQGSTSAANFSRSNNQQIRSAAAHAYQALLSLASTQLGVPTGSLSVTDGVVSGGGRTGTYGQLLGDKVFNVTMNPASLQPGISPAKPISQYKIVGTRVPRIELPDKITGKYTYIQNVRIPGMLHGRVVRPKGQSAWGNGAKPLRVDESSIKHIPNVQVVRVNDFLGVVAPKEYDAIQAAAQLKVTWAEPELKLPSTGNLFNALRATTGAKTNTDYYRRVDGNANAALASAAKTVHATYRFAYQAHHGLGPSCAVADVKADSAVVMGQCRNIYANRTTAATYLGLPPTSVRVIFYEGASNYGSNPNDDAWMGAVVMSKAVGKPVRLQFMRWDEHGYDLFEGGVLTDHRAGIDEKGKVVALDHQAWNQGSSSGTMSQLLASTAPVYGPLVGNWGPSSAMSGSFYDFPNRQVLQRRVENGWLLSSVLRTPHDVGAAFATEQTIDALAHAANMDPVEFRRLNLAKTPYGEKTRPVLDAVAKLANWTPRVAATKLQKGDVVTGRGVAIATHYPFAEDNTTVQNGLTPAVVIADIEVNKKTGRIAVKHLFGGLDVGIAANLSAVESQMWGELTRGTGRALLEAVRFDSKRVTGLDWVSYPILRFKDHPTLSITVLQNGNVMTAAGEEGEAAPAGAIANAFFDATGVRLYDLPMTPSVVRATLQKAAS